jgi:hypothetical protein
LTDAKNAPAPSARDPYAALRGMAERQLADIARLQGACLSGLSLKQHESLAKSLFMLARLAEQLFAADPSCPPKTGDQLREEDDALRAEFERRLASLLRGREIAGSLGAGPQRGSPPNASGLAQLDASASERAGGQRLAPVAHLRRSRLRKIPGRGGMDQA